MKTLGKLFCRMGLHKAHRVTTALRYCLRQGCTWEEDLDWDNLRHFEMLKQGFLAHLDEAIEAAVAAQASKCKLPPAGWRCTREAGHAGPCAAVRG